MNIYLTDRILEAKDRKKLTAHILSDFSKALDSILNQKLILQLSNVGASPSTVN